MGHETSGTPESSDMPGETDRVSIARLEELSRRAWPALAEERIDGWLVGASGGYTRRANCVSALSGGLRALDERIDRVESHYAGIGLRPVFKLHPASQPRDLDAALARRGYLRRSETIVMTRRLDVAGTTPPPQPCAPDAARIVSGRLDREWFDASVSFSQVAESSRLAYRAILDRILATVDAPLFGSVGRRGAIRSLALGCLVADTLSLLQVATEPRARGQGLAGLVLAGLLEDARERGGTRALLAVETDNAPARRLYERAGFVERYRYAYREAPETAR